MGTFKEVSFKNACVKDYYITPHTVAILGKNLSKLLCGHRHKNQTKTKNIRQAAETTGKLLLYLRLHSMSDRGAAITTP